MDPYLEGSEWTSVHTELSTEIARQLAPKLAPKYVARTMQRFVSDIPESVSIEPGDIYPDVGVFDARRQGGPVMEPFVAAAPAVELPTVIPTRVPLVTIEIRDVAERQLVTAIEVLSPTNKRGDGYREYLDKRGRVLASVAHLIEIDLLRRGRRVPMQRPLPAAPYYVFVGRTERRPMVEVWPIQLPDRLPVVPVPLLEGDPDVPLDLQQALDRVYDGFRYDLSIDYTRPPDIPLTGSAADWAVERIRAAGITPAV